jgi:hypothetical protein
MSALKSVTLLTMLSAIVVPQNASTQDIAANSGPLTVTTDFSFGLSAECKDGQGLTVRLHYTGKQPLRGYLIALGISDSKTGKGFQQQVLEEARNTREPLIESGAEWTRTICSVAKKSSGDRVALNAKVDVLKFADGSTWGPISLAESHRLVGMVDGMNFIEKTTDLQRYVSPIPSEQAPQHLGNIQSQTIGPLRIESGEWRHERGPDRLAVEVTNIGSIPIRGYLLTTSFFDPATGKRIRRVSTKELETHGREEDYLAPGARWMADSRKFSYLSDGSLASYKIDLDLVLFADGSAFGPMKSQESVEVLGMIEGIDRAKREKHEVSANEKH